MASLRSIVRISRGISPSLHASRSQLSQNLWRRGIHQSPVALKKKGQHVAEDDPFADEDSLFGSSEGEELFSTAGEPARQETSPTARVAQGKLNPETRLARFDELLKFVGDRVGLKPVTTKLQVRNTAWQHLFDLATTKEQMEQVVELFPKWRDSRRVFTEKCAEAFVRRCEELKCPTLALKVFSNHTKYGFDLSSIQAGRHLLHSLHVEHPIQETITLAALYKVYNLPAISSDLISCAMLTSACFKEGSEQSLVVAKAMVPSLREMLEKTDAKEWALVEKGQPERARLEVKEKAWLAWTLAKIEKALSKQGEEFEWLRRWRESVGHTQAVA